MPSESDTSEHFVPKMTSNGLPKLGIKHTKPKDLQQDQLPKVASYTMRAMINTVADAQRDKLTGRRKKK